MGVFAGGGDVDVAAIAAEMRPAVELWFNGIVQIVDPGLDDGIFDPFTNEAEEGGEPSVIWQGSARIQPIRTAIERNVGYQSIDTRAIRFQVPRDIAEQGVIRKGLQVWVVDGGEDTTLENYRFTVKSGVNSSGMWTRTIEAEVDLTAVQDAPDPVVP